jgi:lactoylglutathione lyase
VPLHDAFTILHSPDVARATSFYTERLGFEERYRFESFVLLGLDTFELGLTQTSEVAPAGRVALWLYSDDVDREIEGLRAAGVPVAQEPEDMEWGERMAAVLDPDGNEVFIGQRLVPPDREQ